MEIKKITIGAGVVLSLLGGGLGVEYRYNPDIKIGNRVITEYAYNQLKPKILEKYKTKTSSLFYWTEEGREMIDVMNIELQKCVKSRVTVSGVKVQDQDEVIIDGVYNLIKNNCL